MDIQTIFQDKIDSLYADISKAQDAMGTAMQDKLSAQNTIDNSQAIIDDATAKIASIVDLASTKENVAVSNPTIQVSE